MPTSETAAYFFAQILWVLVLLGIALVPPNSLEMMARYEPAIGVKQPPHKTRRSLVPEWRPSLSWAVLVATIAAVSIIKLGGKSEFLYWQF